LLLLTTTTTAVREVYGVCVYLSIVFLISKLFFFF
jgi:hypothetical protein